MLPVLSQFLCDNESLLEYERLQERGNAIDFKSICRRLVAVERQMDPFKNDMYYDGLGEMYLSVYKDLADLIWKLPYNLSKEYLLHSQGKVYVKAGRFDGWMNLITQLPPLLMVAAAFMERFSMDLLHRPDGIVVFAKENLFGFKYTAQLLPFLPDLDYFVQEEKGLHDLHIHLNGTTEMDVLWNYMLENPYQVTKDFVEVYNAKSAVRKLAEQVIADFTPMKLLERLRTANELREKMIARIAFRNGLFNKEYWQGARLSLALRNLWGDVEEHSSLGIMVEELLLYLLVMSDLRKSKDEVMAGWFHHYLLIKGLVHRFTVMQRTQKGFPQFQLLTENSFRYRLERQYKNRFLQLSGCGGQMYLGIVEGRFSPKDSLRENCRLVSAIVKGYEQARRADRKNGGLLENSDLLLVAHFIKQPESKKGQMFPIRHRFLRKSLRKKALALDKFLCGSSVYSSRIVGIDAAASELDAGPEVFAQTFRFLRKKGIEYCTFHVGEDFRHLLSGLRGIWEAILFLDLRAGDRLGHCTAIGISPELWRKRIGNICFISQGEWLDDLVFVWELIKESRDRELQKLILSVESQISEFSSRIYGETFPPYLLCKAWKLRKYNPFLYLEKTYSGMNDWDMVDSYEEYEEIVAAFNEEKVERLMRMYHAPLCGENCRARYDKLIQIETTGLLAVDTLEILQNIVSERMARKSIVVEALPSSNMRISYYRDLYEYHLRKWLEVENADYLLPSVVLGTDDPGIFMTNIYNEYARAYLHLEGCGFSPMKRMNIISTLQKCSNIYKFRKK
ncbi:hypothetical protein [Bacteroides congonensis]|uniref:hypothetical protein n=1 Tax=Bacteroides congonensis TaxID=1871006 RepID=UPI002674A5E3|nr:hypothetical protein [Bacteroides congonensis]